MCDAAGLKCRLLWKLARRHGWGAPAAQSTLVRSALEPSAQGRGDSLVHELVQEPYVDRVRGDEFFLENDPDSQALAAVRLRETCGYSTLQIEATLSRFEQAGGFDAYTKRRSVTRCRAGDDSGVPPTACNKTHCRGRCLLPI